MRHANHCKLTFCANSKDEQPSEGEIVAGMLVRLLMARRHKWDLADVMDVFHGHFVEERENVSWRTDVLQLLNSFFENDSNKVGFELRVPICAPLDAPEDLSPVDKVEMLRLELMRLLVALEVSPSVVLGLLKEVGE